MIVGGLGIVRSAAMIGCAAADGQHNWLWRYNCWWQYPILRTAPRWGDALTRLHWLCLAVAIGVIGGTLPLLAGRPAALEDWPSHVARVDILAQIQAGDRFWPQFYQPNGVLLPNMSVDLSILGLHALGLPVGVAAELTLLGTYLVFVAAASILAWAARAGDPVKPLIAVVLFYNGALMDGFVNYILGCAIAFCALAAWIAARGVLRRALIAAVGGTVVLFCHIVAAGLLLATIGWWEFVGLMRARPWSLKVLCRHASGAFAAAPVLALVALSPAAATHDLDYGSDLSVAGIVRRKLLLFVHPVIDGIGPRGAAILLTGAALWLAAMALAVRRGQLLLRAPPRWFALVAALTVLFLVAPNGVGPGLGLDYRLPPMVLLLALLLVRLKWFDLWMHNLCVGILLAVVLVRSASLTLDAMRNQQVYRGFVTAARQIPADSMLLSGIGTRRTAISWSAFWQPPSEYMGTLAVRDRVFVPSVFALRSQHTLVLNASFDGLRRQFDVSGPDGLAEMRNVAAAACALWHRLGHTGSVWLVVVYPSQFSDAAFPLVARKAASAGFRLVDVCVTQ